jgi:hypothetical protein
VAVCGSHGFITEARDSPNEPQACPPDGLSLAFNRGFPIYTDIFPLMNCRCIASDGADDFEGGAPVTRVDMRKVQGVP